MKSKLIVFLLQVLFLLAACAPVRPLDPVTVQLKWDHQAQFAGFYAADQQGFYENEGLDVALLPGANLELDTVIDDLLNGTTDFAIRGGDEVLIASAEGQPITAIAIIFQINPWVYATLQDSGIKNPQDFVGKKLMISGDGLAIHQALIKKMEIHSQDIELVPFIFSTEPLANGVADVHQLYQPSLGQSYEMEGYKLNYIWPNDYGVRFYADTIFTTDKMIAEHPEIIEKFLRSTLDGWRYAIENPEETVKCILAVDPSLEEVLQKAKLEAQIPLIYTGVDPIGWMRADIWSGMHAILIEQNILKSPIDLSQVYTMEFLEGVYGSP